MRKTGVFCGLILFFCASANFASAAISTISLNPVVRGWYESPGNAYGDYNANYLTGSYGLEHRSFFTYDLSGVTGAIVAAKLRIYQPPNDDFFDGFFSPSGTETLNLWNVSTPGATLIANSGGAAVFNDLGSGSTYASKNYTLADGGTFGTLTLNALGVNDANSAIGGYFSIGGSVATGGYIFGYSGITPSNTQLILDVTPEPGTLALAVIALLPLTTRPRRQI
jgi:hypothetical protein